MVIQEMSAPNLPEVVNRILVNEFTEEMAEEFYRKAWMFSQNNPDAFILIEIDSYGGDAYALIKMIETMNSIPNPFITYCKGKAMSCGAILLSYGDIRFCGHFSRVMIHKVSAGFPSFGDCDDDVEMATETARINDLLLGLLAKSCGLTLEELHLKIRETTSGKEIWLSAEEAEAFGLVDKIGVPEVKEEPQWAIDLHDIKYKRESLIPKDAKPGKKKTTKRVKKKITKKRRKFTR